MQIIMTNKFYYNFLPKASLILCRQVKISCTSFLYQHLTIKELTAANEGIRNILDNDWAGNLWEMPTLIVRFHWTQTMYNKISLKAAATELVSTLPVFSYSKNQLTEIAPSSCNFPSNMMASTTRSPIMYKRERRLTKLQRKEAAGNLWSFSPPNLKDRGLLFSHLSYPFGFAGSPIGLKTISSIKQCLSNLHPT